MHVVVLGAGVVGVCTAYYLRLRGHRVTLVDRSTSVASGASNANGGQLSYSFTDAMARPGFLRALPGILRGADPAIRIASLTDPALLAFGARFVAQCTRARAQRNTRRMLRLALRSAVLMDELERHSGISFNHRRAGKLVLLRSTRELDSAAATCAMKRELGCDTQTLSLAQAAHIEPALHALDAPFVGAIYSANDAVADPRLFCKELVAWLQRDADMTVCLGHTATDLLVRRGQVFGVRTDKGDMDADAAVVCLGAHSAALLRPQRVQINLYPVRGYSVTLETSAMSPRVSLTDLSNKIVFSRLGDRVRIAGLADFVGHSDAADRERVAQLIDTARRVAPEAANYASQSTHPWGGLRPMTPTGFPYLGPTHITGLHLNTGHGMLGWTTACASSEQVASRIGSATQSSPAHPTAESLCAK